MKGRRLLRAYVLGLAFWALAFILTLKTGEVADADIGLIAQLRLPRALLGAAVGMGLSVSGAALQAVFTNPLCEPYTLGISSGAALGAVLGTALGLEWGLAGLTGTAFVGALLFAGALMAVATRPSTTSLTLLLTGVMFGFLGNSLVALWMAFADANGIQGATFWLMGSLSRARLQGSVLSLAGTLSLTLAIWFRRRELDALLTGPEGAAAIGIPVAAARRRILGLVSVLVALCVSGAGMVGFVGLLVPHAMRRFSGSLHLNLIPLCAIWGAAIVTGADVLARWLARPYELPVAVVTALVGAPAFLWLIGGPGRAGRAEEA